MIDSTVMIALLMGLVAGAALPIGALIGAYWRPADKTMAFLLAFGGGALLAAVTVDLVAGALAHQQALSTVLGAVAGGVVFKLLNQWINAMGGYLRKPSTTINYWSSMARKRLRGIMDSLGQVAELSGLDREQIAALLPEVVIRDYPAGVTLYRPGDPAETLYIVQSGEVELRDPQHGGALLQHHGAGGVFGRRSFLVGSPRTSEAVTVGETRLLFLPRRAFFKCFEENPRLRDALASALKDLEIQRFLQERLGLDRKRVDQWLVQALAQLAVGGSYQSPTVLLSSPEEDLADALEAAGRTDFFRGLTRADRERIAKRLIVNSAPEGHRFFRIGELGERLYLLRRGHVALMDPDDTTRRPIMVQPGEVFGRASFLARGTHSVTAVAASDCELLVLRREAFDALLSESDTLREVLADHLADPRHPGVLPPATGLDTARAASWLDHMVAGSRVGHLFPSLGELKANLDARTLAFIAIPLGLSIDSVPESLVMGSSLVSGGAVSLPLIGAILLSNFPEALSSAAGMREQGVRPGRVLLIWLGMMLLTALAAGFGALTMQGAPPHGYALLEGFAAGAMLTVVIETMLPEAYHKGGGIIGLSTLVGFLVAVLLAAIV